MLFTVEIQYDDDYHIISVSGTPVRGDLTAAHCVVEFDNYLSHHVE